MKETVSEEFSLLYDKVNKDSKTLALEILKIVSKNDIRLLKKVDIRLSECINKIKTEVK